MWTNHKLFDVGFKNHENKGKLLQSEALISHSIFFSEQIEILATST